MKRITSVLLCTLIFVLAIVGCGVKKAENIEIVVHMPDVDRTGTYTGEMKDDKPNGQGVFKTVNSEGIGWTYTGEFKDGAFDGIGVQEWTAGQRKEGLFKNNAWQPTPVQVYRLIDSQYPDSSISDKTYEYVEKNQDVFLSRNKDKLEPLVNTAINPADIIKDPMAYGDSLVQLTNVQLLGVDVDASQHNIKRYTFTDGERLFCVFFFDQMPSITKGDQVDVVYGLPLFVYSIAQQNGKSIPAIAFAGCYAGK